MMVETPPPRRYEFSISRAGADAAVAKEVADVLRHAGHTVQYQDEDIPFGANFIERMSQLVEGCKHLLVILSPAYLGSPYCREEWTNFLADLFADQDDRRVVVLLAHDCKPPGILRARVFGSLFDKTDPAERRTTILSAAEGRAARTKIDPALFQVPVPHNPAFCGRDNVFAKLDDARFFIVADQHLRDTQKRPRGKGNCLRSGMGERVIGRAL
jgi:TIR domain